MHVVNDPAATPLVSRCDESWHSAFCTLCACVTCTALLAEKQQVQASQGFE